MNPVAPVESNINPLALLFLLVASVVVIACSRRNAVKALLVTAAIVPLGQQLVLLGLHLHFFRILILAGLVRLVVRHEARGFHLILVDKLTIAWVCAEVLCGILRGPKAETFGFAYNALGTYFLVRVLTQDAEDLVAHLRFLALVGLIIGLFMASEAVSHRNAFALLGGVPEIPDLREGRPRCQGPFRHPILAGTFGATLFPLAVGLWFEPSGNKTRALMGLVGSLIITGVSVSSGALLTLMAAILGFALWPMRERMRLFRRGAVVLVLGLALVMKAPVWYLISRVSDLVGGTGWHRSYLIDQFVQHFNEWWLIGTSYTAEWAPAGQVLVVDPNNMDITNHYVAQGVGGGIWMLGLFLAIIVCSFKIVGRTVHGELPNALEPKLVWALGVTLAAHCTAFISISYFDQIQVFWFWLLAIIACLALGREVVLQEQPVLSTNEFADQF